MSEAQRRHSALLIATGVFVMLWTIARACVQSVTIDEADTYLYFVATPGPSHWIPMANNHVLNSMLMRLTTSIFGASAITLRLPALIGTLLYLWAVYCLVRLISERRWLSWALFTCLACNPFVMDYLVAARGYSMALAFLLWMVVIAGWHQRLDPKARAMRLLRICALISVLAALSVCANFSFAIADGLTALGMVLWISREHRRDLLKILAACTLPGLAVAYFLVGPVVFGWPRGELARAWGTDSLFKTVGSLVSASLFEPNNNLLHPRIYHYFVHFGRFLYPILAGLVLWRLVVLARERRLNPLAVVCGLAIAGGLAAHQFLFTVFGVKLPLERTAMWVVVLFLAMAGALAAEPDASAMGRASAKALTALLALIACYNIGCLRLNYFNEWKYDADMKNVYAVLASYNHTYGVTRVSANWRYVAALNCYRAMSGRESLEEVPRAPTQVNEYPPGYQAYVFYYGADEDFYRREGLKLVYHDSFTDAAVGIRPESLAPPAR
jgi:hypothetical protein